MKLSYGLFIILTVSVVCSCSTAVDSICNMTGSVTSTSFALEQLQEWCSEDPRCSFMFRQRPGSTNMTIFKFLALPLYNEVGGDLISPVAQILCGDRDPFDIIKDFWTLFLVAAQVDNKPQCGVNKRLVLNQDKMILECLCDAESNCSEPSSDYSFVLALLIICIVIVTICCICNFANTAFYFRIVRNSAVEFSKRKTEEPGLFL